MSSKKSAQQGVVKYPPARILSLNIEGGKHLENVSDLIRETDPDIICLQEVRESEYKSGYFTDVDGRWKYLQRFDCMGISEGQPLGLLTLWPYSDAQNHMVKYFERKNDGGFAWNSYDPSTYHRMLQWVRYGGFTVANTHFTWTPNGQPSAAQWEDARSLRACLNDIVSEHGGFLCCGDFNAPRGRPVYALLTEGYRDFLPLSIESTIDPDLHRDAPLLSVVVDTIFGTHDHRALEIRVVSGVSDHMAIIADVEKS